MKLVDFLMTRLFLLAEYVCSKTGVAQVKAEPAAPPSQTLTPTIRFSDADRMVEGELFK